MLQAPTIAFPMTDWTAGQNEAYYTSNLIQEIAGTIPVPANLSANRILTVAYRYKIKNGNTETPWTQYSVAGIVAGDTNLNAETVAWSFDTEGYISISQGDTVTFNFKSLEFVNRVSEVGQQVDESLPVTLIANVVSSNAINPSVGIPTGVSIEQSRDWIKILVPSDGFSLNDNTDFLGCNFYLSLVAGGGETGYAVINDSYINDVDTTEREENEVEQSNLISEADNLRTQTTVYLQQQEDFYTFTLTKSVLRNLVLENRIPNVFLSDNETLNEDIVYYFTTTAIGYDKTLNQVVESYFSIELEGRFVRYSTDFRGLPRRQRPDILYTMSRRLGANNERVNVVTGQVIRDLLDSTADEFSRQYLVQDFVFRSESIDSLLLFDDADGDGVSDDPLQSPNKRLLADALSITDPQVVQELIDQQFDKKASNFNLERRGAVQATGRVTFYTTRQPSNDILIQSGSTVTYPGDPNLNIDPVNFQVVGQRIIDADNADSYFNPTSGRYEVEAEIRAVIPGISGNVPARSITVVNGLDPSLSVINETPTNYGSDEETNQQLGARVKLARSSFDSGTKPGYLATAYGVAGVVEANVQEVGDPLMVRDWDKAEGRHIGGKVDVYIRGTNVVQNIDQVAFKFEYPTDVIGDQTGEQFFVIDSRDFRIKTNNPKVTADTPIVLVNKVRNITRGADYDLTGIEILSDTIILSDSSQVNQSIGMATLDVIEVNYRYRSSNILILQNQPVRNISEVTDKDGAAIDGEEYRLVRRQDPLVQGRSTISADGVEFLFDSQNDVDEFITITGEEHNIRLNTPAQLVYKGVDLSSVVVRSSDDPTIVYRVNVDYTVSLGSQTEFTNIVLKPNGMIRTGDRILVDYQASSNFFVTYSHNQLLQTVQTRINSMKHACADTIVKGAVENFIDLSFNVERNANVTRGLNGSQSNDESRLRARIQTAIFNVVSGKKMGETLTQAELVRAVFSVEGVKSVSTPFTMMQKRNGSFIPLDNIGNVAFEIFQRTAKGGITSYRTIDSVLTYSTTENGGLEENFRAVYEDTIALELVDDPTKVADAPGRAYIQADGKIIVSTRDGRPPQSKSYSAAYYVTYAAGVMVAQDIQTAPIEYLNVDSVSFRGIDFIN